MKVGKNAVDREAVHAIIEKVTALSREYPDAKDLDFAGVSGKYAEELKDFVFLPRIQFCGTDRERASDVFLVGFAKTHDSVFLGFFPGATRALGNNIGAGFILRAAPSLSLQGFIVPFAERLKLEVSLSPAKAVASWETLSMAHLFNTMARSVENLFATLSRMHAEHPPVSERFDSAREKSFDEMLSVVSDIRRSRLA